MRTRAAVLYQSPGRWSVEEVELDDPKEGEVLVEMVASGLCHSDDHISTGDMLAHHYPFVAGHEGGGIVTALGPNTKGFEVGDHVLTSFIPACGNCRWCAMGMQNMCDLGALIMQGHQLDGTFRMHTLDGKDIGTASLLGSFAEMQVYDSQSVLKIEKDIPLEIACLVACGVQTGFGSATSAGEVKPGDVVLVVGVGGIGMNAVQGARAAGAAHIIAADPVPDKQKWALDFGATESFDSIASSMSRIHELTDGQGADVAILTAGIVPAEMIGEGFQAIRKAGTLVITGLSPEKEESVIPGVNAAMIAIMQKRIQGALYGMKSPKEAMPMLLNMYRAGALKLDELVTKTYTLDQINQGFADMRTGSNIRGVIHYS
jgi:S-(hydroxymethyl)glutathione dehydrogenase/alcohol dehydrogenase